MPHHVYANNNEIASSSADGKSTAAAPDVCWSPPPPTAGPIPIPYANTCFAKDICNGSRTVFIKKGQIALENKSYFRTSTGNEAATKTFKKGIVSGKIKGKGYFASWSPNVKVEGLGVARHMDSVTHNHKNPGNALIQKYKSKFSKDPSCLADKKRIKNKCKNKKNDKKKTKPKKKSLLKRLKNLPSVADKAAQQIYGYNPKKPATKWMKDHCDGLWVKPSGQGEAYEKAQEQINEMLEMAQDPWKVMDHAVGQVWEMAQSQLSWWYLAKAGLKLGGKALVKNIIGGAAGTTGVGLAVTAAMAASTVADVVNTLKDIAQKIGPEAMDHIDDLMNMNKLEEKAKEKLQEYKDKPSKAMADAQTVAARLNPCAQARRCQLVPFEETGALTAANADNNKGCCPGQTGHHILPDSMLKGNSCYKGKAKAPTMCMEGTSNSSGSHGAAHDRLLKSMGKYRTDNKTEKIPYKDAKEKAIDSVAKKPGGPASGCNRDCLEAQLDAYYKECEGKDLKATAGSNKKDAPIPDDQAGDDF